MNTKLEKIGYFLIILLSSVGSAEKLYLREEGGMQLQCPTNETQLGCIPHSPSEQEIVPLAAPTNSASLFKWDRAIAGGYLEGMSFIDDKVGYVAGELGIVSKTEDGGHTWNRILNMGYPHYWYGVQGFNNGDVLIIGFSDDASGVFGEIRWSHDGGKTWGPVLRTKKDDWLFTVKFADRNHGIILNLLGTQPSYYTENGGEMVSDWIPVHIDPKNGWFGQYFSFLPNLDAAVAGINFCKSHNGGERWKCKSETTNAEGGTIDPVFDGAITFLDDKWGAVVGGEISPDFRGWVHVTSDGGKHWTDRVLTTPFPLRDIAFIGGLELLMASGCGGIYISQDQGRTWTLEFSAKEELHAIQWKRAGGNRLDVWVTASIPGTGPVYHGVLAR